MNKKLVLFIDDGDITEVIGKLDRALKKIGITLVPSFLSLKEDRFRKVDPGNAPETILDFDIIKQELQAKYMSEKYDLVACDFSFIDKYLTGFILTKWLKNVSKAEKKRIRNAKFILYSSEREKSLATTFQEEDMGDLIRLKIDDFIDRTELAERLATIINNSLLEVNLSGKMISELDKFHPLTFKSTYPKFEGKTLKEIIHEIEEETHHGRIFQETIIELAISHMVDLNQE